MPLISRPALQSFRNSARRHRLATLLACLVIALVAFVLVRPSPHEGAGAGSAADPKAAHGGKGGRGGPPVPVEVAEVRRGEVGEYLNALGTVTPLNTVAITSRVQGQVVAVHFREGQDVKKGDPLVSIDPRPFEAAVLQAEGQLARDQAALQSARLDLERYRKAYVTRAVSKQQLDNQRQLALQYEGAVKADEGAVRAARLNVEFAEITSPIDGRAGLRLVDMGNVVQATASTPLVTITQLRPITVLFSVAEDHLPRIREQLRAGHEMTVEAYDRAQERKLAQGAFLTLDNQVDVTTGTVRAKGAFDNADGALFPNQFVNVRLLVTTERNAFVVPTAAIQNGSQGPFVYVVKPDQTTEIRKVKTGLAEGGITAVEGVNPDERIAVSSFDRLENGTRVAVRAADDAHNQMAGSAQPNASPSAQPSAAPQAPPSARPGAATSPRPERTE